MTVSNSEALHRAAAEGDLAEVERLLKTGLDVNGVVSGETALHIAVKASRRANRDAVVHALLQAGTNINALDQQNATPLMHACLIGEVNGSRIALRLLERGADAEYTRQSDGATALRFAVTRASPAVINALIDRGASVDGPPGSLITPLMRAVVEGNMESVKTLVQRGANLDIQCALPWAKGKTAEEIAIRQKKVSIAAFLRTHRTKSS